MASKVRTMRLRLAVGGGLLAVAAVGVAARYHAGADSAAPAPSASAYAALSADPLGSLDLPADPATPADVSAELKRTTLADAITAAKPHMSDTRDQLDEGSAMLAMWAAKNLTWSALAALPETSPALFRKDPGFERGRRLCVTGRILEIRAEKDLERRLTRDHPLPLVSPDPATTSTSMAMPGPLSGPGATGDGGMPDLGLGGGAPVAQSWRVPDGGKVFFAVLTTAPKKVDDLARMEDKNAAPLVVSAIAVRSTGTLVDGDSASVCGVLTGVNEIEADTGKTLSHRVVGMFDLPENHASPTAANK